jgi:predicted translin family RNA/ssDNA-binding protein
MAQRAEEIARMTAQRDEARQEIVELMREVEAKREADEKVARLEMGQKEMEGRLDEALVMLGEKSERVEELEQDVKDIKEMYRDLLLDRTGK